MELKNDMEEFMLKPLILPFHPCRKKWNNAYIKPNTAKITPAEPNQKHANMTRGEGGHHSRRGRRVIVPVGEGSSRQ
jgi:hypothetical protein